MRLTKQLQRQSGELLRTVDVASCEGLERTIDEENPPSVPRYAIRCPGRKASSLPRNAGSITDDTSSVSLAYTDWRGQQRSTMTGSSGWIG